MKKVKKIIVVGAGILGLTCALKFLENGYDVEIIFKVKGQSPHYALWEIPPYKVEPENIASEIAMVSYKKFLEIFENYPQKLTGVHSTTCINILPSNIFEKNSYGESFLKDYKYGKEAKDCLLSMGFLNKKKLENNSVDMYHSWLIVTKTYMQWLESRIKDYGGKFTRRNVKNLNELSQNDKTLIINCTGLGSRFLLNDLKVYPIKGQIVLVEKPEKLNNLSVSVTCGSNYVFICPGEKLVECGGDAREDQYSRILDHDVSESILENCKSMIPSLNSAKVKDFWAGLRPGRKEGIRLERKGNIIHCYGLGGSGFVCSWGCAEKVYQLSLISSSL